MKNVNVNNFDVLSTQVIKVKHPFFVFGCLQTSWHYFLCSSLKKDTLLWEWKHLFFFFLFLKKFIYFTLQYWFCHTLTWIRHECTCVPHPKPPSHLPPYSIPLGHLSVPALSTLYHASNLGWQFVSHVIFYMFQCHSPKSSHLRPLPQSPEDCSIHLCLFSCLAYRVIVQFSSVQLLSRVWLFATPWIAARVTFFLNSIYMC